ncbi:MAG: hypothetical protein LBB56_08785, partial [Chitinispirillales bacterium]|nr:hypothetical protein [Chitinispirillales bacterium]
MKRIISILIVIAIIIPVFTITVKSEENWSGYIKISNPEDLKLMDGSRSNFYLTNDIDLSDWGVWQPISWFGGTLDGNGYAIKNITTTNGGLFHSLGRNITNGGTIKNLGLQNVNIRRGAVVGALSNYAYFGTVIENCYITGTIIS